MKAGEEEESARDEDFEAGEQEVSLESRSNFDGIFDFASW